MRGRNGLAVASLILCAGALRLSPSLDAGLHPWDERYHALVGKHIIDEPWSPMLYTDPLLPHDDARWTEARIWLNKPPLSLWCIGISLKVFGLHALAVRIPKHPLRVLRSLVVP